MGLALRVAVASTLCLLVSELFHLQHASLSVYSVHLVMVQFNFSAFQKGVERVLGRVVGVLFGLAVVELLHNAPWLYLAILFFGQLFFFYIYASGRFAYAALNGGLFIGILGSMGLVNIDSVSPFAWAIIPQLLLGSGMAAFINWITGAERSARLHLEGDPFVPVRLDWLNTAFMLTTVQTVTLFAAELAGLPVLPTCLSATLLAVAPAGVGIAAKGYQRMQGAFLGGGAAFVSIVLLRYLPYVSLLLMLVFFTMFVAAYMVKMSKSDSYSFLQAGLVMPLVLIDPDGGVGTLEAAYERLVGVWAGFVIAEMIALAWPRLEKPAPPGAPPPPPAPEATEDEEGAG